MCLEWGLAELMGHHGGLVVFYVVHAGEEPSKGLQPGLLASLQSPSLLPALASPLMSLLFPSWTGCPHVPLIPVTLG